MKLKEVRLDGGLAEAVRRLVEERAELGYLDEDEFTRDALRRFLHRDVIEEGSPRELEGGELSGPSA